MEASVLFAPREPNQKQNNQMKTTNKDNRTMKRTLPETEDFAALLGLDWGSQAHALCLYDCATGHRGPLPPGL